MVHDHDALPVSRRSLIKVSGGAAALGALALTSRGWSAHAQDATPMATPSTCPELTLDQMKEIARQFLTAWEGVVANPDAFAALLTDDFVYHWGLGADSYGAEETIARVAAYVTAVTDQHFAIQAIYGEGDTVIVRWTATSTQTGQFGAISPSSVPAEYSGINIFRFSCGLIAESWNETDQFGRLVQIGVITDDELGTVGTPTP